jgi:hypothetical protein
MSSNSLFVVKNSEKVNISDTCVRMYNTIVDLSDTQCETDCIKLAYFRKLRDRILKECSLSCRQSVLEKLWLEYALAKAAL